MLVRGRVLVDGTGDGLGGVRVTDGRSWAITDVSGRFSLSATGPSVWVRRPDGWDAASWWCAPDSQLTFRLRAVSNRRRLRVAHLTDAHVSTLRGHPGDAVELVSRHGDGTDPEAALRAAFAHAAGRGATLALVTGDLTDHGTPEELRRFAACAAGAPLTVCTVPGNHDHYGHRQEPRVTDRPRGDGFLGSCTVDRYEAELGPRWWSMDRCGLHLLALDWFSDRCGVDSEEQRRFVADDLGSLAEGAPVLVLSHDQPGAAWFDHVRAVAPGVRLVGVLSGHWHAPKAVAVDGCDHVCTGSVSVGGLDWTPPQLRLLDWDGAALAVGDPERPGDPTGAPRRSTVTSGGGRRTWRVGAGQHLAAVVPCGDRFLVPSLDPDRRGGVVVSVDPVSGPRWRRRVGGAPVTGLATDGDAVVAVGLAGDVCCLAAGDGSPRWRQRLADPCRSRLLAAPVLAPGGVVVAGDLGGVAAFQLATGRRLWAREDLGPPDTLLTYGAGAVGAASVVLPFGGPHRGLTSLALGDGTTEWTDPPGTPPPLSTVVSVGEGDALVVRDGPLLERFELRTGAVRWRTRLAGRFSTAPPHRSGGRVTVVTGDGVLHRLDAESGLVVHHARLGGLRPGYGPYRTTGTGAPTAPVMVGEELIIVLIDGSIWRLPDGDEPPVLVGDLDADVTAQPAARDGRLAVVDTTGRLHLLTVACRPLTSSPRGGTA
jgi:predicted phosphodiesterase